MRYLICYDIADNKKRRKIAKFLEAFGIRIQGSVFVGDFTKQQYMEIRNQLINYADADDAGDINDSIYMCPMCDRCWSNHWYIGADKETELKPAIVI